ncbi:hypothetical protein CGLO_12239 [Colletotrichum gloeosporioides Cg-14]|uniref:Uncharacterized protein n=1 Tax=Colletotrichum gloeosporioides (strain Cg-14) TaxID=1237896 RepID=T0K6D5_COLGC|nr:hypothetical protein CGLO_12239 [Colletotrichum gloeosporioides Cg-14]
MCLQLFDQFITLISSITKDDRIFYFKRSNRIA